jgi:hypothetical protein
MYKITAPVIAALPAIQLSIVLLLQYLLRRRLVVLLSR